MAPSKTDLIGSEQVQTKQAVIGILIFAIVTILSYSLLYAILNIGEGLSVIIALVLGGVVEFAYRKRTKNN
ncbi:hypothetical protein BkAM31D_17545 [Halalkalibacter krulwichiae]|uniref:Uncharacterized protein n=1 Tax=Halalkalibacter krulwichiae TaxID=199441 RepID=A0A1X9MDI9_9BACI|nr:hypothetical protein [Halalkalibacter krulwichiae]ARK31498.1 hypothetical protein BkAM31D_17545 [Halalkalibacter krulwichiae]